MHKTIISDTSCFIISTNIGELDLLQKVLEMQLYKGEASAFALALETSGSTIIIDDYCAKKVAEKLQMKYTGTIGIIIKAKIKGIILSIKPLLAKIKQTDFRITDEIERQALQEAGE